MTQASDISETGNDRRSQMTRQQIGRLVDEVDELSRADGDPVQFHHELLDRAVRGTAAVAGYVWIIPAPREPDESQSPLLECHTGLQNIAWPEGKIPPPADWLPLFKESVDATQPISVAANASTASGGFQNPLANILTAAAFPADDEFQGGVVLVHEGGLSPEFQQGTQQLLAVLCDLAADFQRRQRLRDLTGLQSEQRAFENFRRNVLDCDDAQSLGRSIANEGQRYLKCDRVSMIVRRNRRFVVQSVSGVDSIDRRSTTVLKLQELAVMVASEGKPCWFEQGNQTAVGFLSETGAVNVGVYPLTNARDASKATAAVHSVMVVEMFTAMNESAVVELKQRADRVAEHFAPVLGLMNRVDSLPLIGISRFLNRSVVLRSVLRWRLKWIVLTLIVAAAVAAAMTPADFDVEARGTLQPVEQEFIYAPRDGIVADFPAVEDNVAESEVHPGDIVIELRNSELDLELTRVLGQQQTLSGRLNTVTVLLEQLARTPGAERTQFAQLTAEKLELEIELASVSEQLKILREEKNQLAVRTKIRGRIQTWDFVKRLKSRPVRQGGHLMTVANIKGPWRLELNIPDQSIDDVNTAQQQSQGDVSIRFLIRSAPEKHHSATLQNVANVTQYVENLGLCVTATATLKRNELPENLRPGTAVIAKIHCGRRSLAFVWLHSLIRSVRQRLLF